MDLTASLRDLFKQMSETQEGFPPLMFLNALRAAFPQFAQKAKDGHGYAQQDAEEAWSQIVSQLRQKLKIKDTVDEDNPESSKEVAFVDKYIAGRFESIMQCDEPGAKEAGEEPVSSSDPFFKLNCHMNAETNHLRDGLAAGLQEKIEKRSPTLERDAVYTKSSQISRLPKYLPVHFMRFDWRRTTNKKAKIMRKVTFPHELDVVEFCADDLKSKLIPIRDKIRDIQKDEEDILRARKRQKRIQQGEDFETDQETKAKAAASSKEAGTKRDGGKKKDASKGEDSDMKDAEYKTDAQVEAEKVEAVAKAKKELLTLVDPKLGADASANQTGLFELRGVITHQGATADSGHYTAFVKKSGSKDAVTGKRKEEDGKWWWFNDDKVSEVDSDRIDTLSGGGEQKNNYRTRERQYLLALGQSHSALILLYRAVPLPTQDD